MSFSPGQVTVIFARRATALQKQDTVPAGVTSGLTPPRWCSERALPWGPASLRPWRPLTPGRPPLSCRCFHPVCGHSFTRNFPDRHPEFCRRASRQSQVGGLFWTAAVASPFSCSGATRAGVLPSGKLPLFRVLWARAPSRRGLLSPRRGLSRPLPWHLRPRPLLWDAGVCFLRLSSGVGPRLSPSLPRVVSAVALLT